MKWIYLIAALVGTVLPLWFFIPFLMDHGLDAQLVTSQLFANQISSGFAMDILVSALILWLFVLVEGRRLLMRQLWIYVICTLLVGVSLAFPLFLFFRQRQIESEQAPQP